VAAPCGGLPQTHQLFGFGLHAPIRQVRPEMGPRQVCCTRTQMEIAMELPGPPLSIGTLSEKEVEVLRKLLTAAKKQGYLEQKDFMGKDAGGDIRNFLAETANDGGTRGKRYRDYQRFLKKLYDYAMSTLPAQIAESDSQSEVAQLIRQLFKLGVESPRYERDITYYMNSFIEGDIVNYNVPKHELGYFIGYRYSSDQKRLLRFLVYVFLDKTINRTRFWSYLNLMDSDRETHGFAYYATRTGNTYLSGFIDQGLGCEFIAHKALLDNHIHSGVIITTDSKGFPTAKQCVLIDAKKTKYAKDLPDINYNILNEYNDHQIFKKMEPIDGDNMNAILDEELVISKRYTYRIDDLLTAELMTEIPHDTNLKHKKGHKHAS
jgi:hypothetical protein